MRAFILIVTTICLSTATDYHVAVDLPFSNPTGSFSIGLNMEEIMDMIFDNINRNIMNETGDRIIPVYFDNLVEDQVKVFRDSVEISNICGTKPYEFMAVVGPDFTFNAEPFAQYLSAFNILVVSSEATGDALSDKTLYPNFVRVTITDSYEAGVLAQYIASVPWSRVAILASNDGYGSSLTQAFSKSCAELGITIVASEVFQVTSSDTVTAALNALKAVDARIIVVFADNVAGLFTTAASLGMTTLKYVYLGTDGSLPASAFPLGSLATNIALNESMPGVAQFNNDILHLANTTWGPGIAEPNEYQPHLDDAARLIAHSLVKLSKLTIGCTINNRNIFCQVALSTCATYNTTLLCINLADGCVNGNSTLICPMVTSLSGKRQILIQLAFQTPFVGVTGLVQLDLNGNRAEPCSIVNQQQALPYGSSQNSTSMVQVAVLSPGTRVLGESPGTRVLGESTRVQIVTTAATVWPGHLVRAPSDRRGARTGDSVTAQFDSVTIVLSFTTAIVDSWLASILFENVIYSYYHSSLSVVVLWIISSTFSLTLAIWSSMIIGITSLRIPDLPDGVTILYLADIWGPAFLVPVVPIILAFTLAGMHFFRSNEPVLPVGTKLRMSSQHGGCKLLPLFIGACILTCAILASHFTVNGSLVLPCTTTHNAGIQFVAVLVTGNCCTLSMYMFFRARSPHYRFLGAVAMTGAIMSGQFISLGAEQYVYSPHVLDESAVLSIVPVLVAIIATAVSFVLLIGLNVVKLKLSRDALDDYLNRERQKVLDLESSIKKMDNLLSLHDKDASLLKCIHPSITLEHPALGDIVTIVNKMPTDYKCQYLNPIMVSDVELSPLLKSQQQWTAKPKLPAHDVLKNSVAFELIKQKMLLRRDSESILFLADLAQYERTSSQQRSVLCKYLIDTYLLTGSPCEINIGSGLRKRTTEKAIAAKYATNRKYFDDVENAIVTLISSNILTDVDTATLCAYILEAHRISTMTVSMPTMTVTVDSEEGTSATLGQTREEKSSAVVAASKTIVQ